MSPTAGCFRVAPPATHADAAHQQVDRAPDSPQPRAEIPAALAANPPNGNKRAVCIDRHVDPAPVDQLATEACVGRRRCRSSRGARIRPPRQRERTILVADGATDRFAQADRSYREYRKRRGIGDDGPVLQSRDQFTPDPRVDGRDEPQPETRQTRGQQRHRDHHALQPTLPGVLAHHVAVARLIGAADFERATLPVGQLQRSGKIGEHVIDADRLRQCRDPPRANHDRQPIDERTDQLERQAPGPDHDRRAKFHDGNSALAQRLSGLDPALEMLAERLVAGCEAAEVARAGEPRRAAPRRRNCGRRCDPLCDSRRAPPWSAPGNRRRRCPRGRDPVRSDRGDLRRRSPSPATPATRARRVAAPDSAVEPPRIRGRTPAVHRCSRSHLS